MKSEKGKIVFEKINRQEYSNKGKIVAIEVESGDYFMGDNIIEAYNKAKKNHPFKEFIFRRIGFLSSYFAGTF